eukprot:13186034-Heterocapsa_arctica.AAC.1
MAPSPYRTLLQCPPAGIPGIFSGISSGPFPDHAEELGLWEGGRGDGGLAGSLEPLQGVSMHGLLAIKSSALTTK